MGLIEFKSKFLVRELMFKLARLECDSFVGKKSGLVNKFFKRVSTGCLKVGVESLVFSALSPAAFY